MATRDETGGEIDRFLITAGDRPVHVCEICEALQIQRGNLHSDLSCRDRRSSDHLPAQQATRTGSCGAIDGRSRVMVRNVAMAHGFRELGRFAAHYRRLFGELPSQPCGGVGDTMCDSHRLTTPASAVQSEGPPPLRQPGSIRSDERYTEADLIFLAAESFPNSETRSAIRGWVMRDRIAKAIAEERAAMREEMQASGGPHRDRNREDHRGH